VVASIALNLTRAAGSLPSRFQARARLATLRVHLINVPGRLARAAHPFTRSLPGPALALAVPTQHEEVSTVAGEVHPLLLAVTAAAL